MYMVSRGAPVRLSHVLHELSYAFRGVGQEGNTKAAVTHTEA
jgi:hypothetical protein